MASTGDTWRLGRRPALDGLRGVAVLLVAVCHSNIPQFLAAGSVGVTMFFTLSGFLITALMLQEHAESGRIALGQFYARRARRLLPAMLVMVAVVATYQAAADVAMSPLGVLLSVLYLGNFVGALGLPVTALAHMWSLAIEEQFYLLWPLLVILGLRRSPRALVVVAGAGIVASNVIRGLVWDGGDGALRIYSGSDTRADALLVGCLVAVLFRLGHLRLGRRAAGLLAVTTLPALMAFSCATGILMWVGVPAAVPWLTALLLVAAVGHGVSLPLLSWPPLMLLGRRSYAFYLWHVPILWFVPSMFGVTATLPRWLIGVSIAWVATLLSWRFVEQPWLSSTSRPRVESRPAQSVAAGRSAEPTTYLARPRAGTADTAA